MSAGEQYREWPLQARQPSSTGQQDAESYLQKHEVAETVQSLLSHVTRVTPANPFSFMADYLTLGTVHLDKLVGREVLDGNGMPTVEVDCYCVVRGKKKLVSRAAAPVGTTTSLNESYILRDQQSERFMGLGMLKCAKFVDQLSDALQGMSPLDQAACDAALTKAEGHPQHKNLGGSGLTASSLALACAGSDLKEVELFQHLGELYNDGKLPRSFQMPLPIVTVLSGGVVESSPLRGQEYCIAPRRDIPYARGLQQCVEVYHNLGICLNKKYGKRSISVDTHGGYTTCMKTADEALCIIEEAIKAAGFIVGIDMFLAIDFNSDLLYGRDDANMKTFHKYQRGQFGTFNCTYAKTQQMVEEHVHLQKKHPALIAIEDPFAEEDYEGWSEIVRAFAGSTRAAVEADTGGTEGESSITWAPPPDPKGAIEYAERYLATALELGKKEAEVRAYGGLADAYSKLGRYDVALNYHGKHLDVAEKAGLTKEVAVAYGLFAVSFRAIGEAQKALECHNKHLEMLRQLGSSKKAFPDTTEKKAASTDNTSPTDALKGAGVNCARRNKLMIVSDHLMNSNPIQVAKGIKSQASNCVSLKINQVGTVSDVMASAKLMKAAGGQVLVSHRGADDVNSFVADLAVGIGANFVRFGAPARSEGVSKYNRLIEIEQFLTEHKMLRVPAPMQQMAGVLRYFDAVAAGHNVEVVRLTQREGVPITAKDRDTTCLHALCTADGHNSAADGHTEVLKYLLENPEVDVNAKDEMDFTPLHIASLNNHIGLIKLLIDNGANRSIQDHFGKRPFDVAVTEECKKMLYVSSARAVAVDSAAETDEMLNDTSADDTPLPAGWAQCTDNHGEVYYLSPGLRTTRLDPRKSKEALDIDKQAAPRNPNPHSLV